MTESSKPDTPAPQKTASESAAGKSHPRMGGIALENGLIFVSERYWGAAVRRADGKIISTSGRKPRLPVGGGGVSTQGGIPLLRGLGRFGESLLVLAQVKTKLPEARLPIEGGRVLAALAAALTASAAVKTAAPRSPLIQEAGGALAAFIPAVLAVRKGNISGYHGAEHKVIGGLEATAAAVSAATGGRTVTMIEKGLAETAKMTAASTTTAGEIVSEAADLAAREAASMKAATKEHDRCGTNLIGPYLLATVATNLLARGRTGEKTPAASAMAGAASLGIALEALRWATNHGDTALARLMLAPGRTVQKRFTTTEPSDEQLEVGRRALKELMRLERAGA